MFRTGAYQETLNTLIQNHQLCIHAFLVAALALATLPDLTRTLTLLDRLIPLHPLPLADVRHMIEARALASKEVAESP